MSTTTAPDLIDDREAAQLLGLKNCRTLAAWRYRKFGPPFVRVGRLIRFSRSDILSWIANRTEQPDSTVTS